MISKKNKHTWPLRFKSESTLDGLVGVTGESVQIEELRIQTFLQVAVTARCQCGSATVIVTGAIGVVRNDP
jgi:hypothetical protein